MKTGVTTLNPNRFATFVASVALLALVAIIDSLTGPEVSLSVFYLIPGALVGWFSGKRQAVIASIASSLIWLVVELKFGRAYQHRLVPYCNGFLQFGMALFSSILMNVVRERQQTVLQEMAARKTAEMDLRLERALAEGMEKEQQRLGKDLHDGLGQHLVSTGFVAAMLKTKLEEKEIAESKDAEELTELIADAIGQTRLISRGLFPIKLEAEGLSSALQELADNVSAHSRVTCRFETSSVDVSSAPSVSSNLYRIAQEAINNALKHAAAKSIVVELRKSRSSLELLVVNDGTTFVSPAEAGRGIGLKIMEHRARSLGGSCRLEPGPLGGARLHCVVPFESV